MSGYMFVIGSCVSCKGFITFNPGCVPSITPPGFSSKQPLCRACFARWNEIHRTSKGLQPVALHPDAYKETKA